MKSITNRIAFLAIVLLIALHFRAYGQCSEFYGMNTEGGPYNTGTLFRTDDEGNLTYSYGFPVLYEGINPNGSLMQASNGKIYGMTTYGGKFNMGVLFEWNPVTGQYLKEFDFDGTERGSHPYGSLIQADNNLIYGMTREGGTNNMGVIFEWNLLTGAFIKKIDFNGSENGKWPYGSLMQAENGNLYGMTHNGGSFDYGVLFELNPITNSFIKKVDFDGSKKGCYPYGSLLQADNGELYGMTSYGGTNNSGILFEYDISSDTLIKEFDFKNIEMGSNPRGSLMQADNGKLYGTTYEGGIYGHEGGHGSYYRYGVMFEWDPGTHVFAKKVNFNPLVTGSNPCGAIVQGDNGALYGMTSGGGLFKWDPLTETCTRIHGYSSSYSTLSDNTLLVGANHKMYGMAAISEKNGNGSLFEFDPDSDTILYKFEFNYAINGDSPLGPLFDGKDGKLYGVTISGGEKNMGVVFVWDILTKTIIKKQDFKGAENGANPSGGLVRGINGRFYGLTHSGGTFNKGVIYEWNPVTNILIKKIDLNDTLGTWAAGSLIQSKNGKFYGTCQEGGTEDEGILFEWDPETNIYTKKVDFSKYETGRWPIGSLVSDNEKLFGVTSYGGNYDNGVIFEYDLLTGTFTKRFEFNGGFDGCSTPLVKASNGKLYGATRFGGQGIVGVFFEFDLSDNQCIKKLEFYDTPHTRYVDIPLMQASNGKLYGLSNYWNETPHSALFEWDPATNIYAEKVIFAGNDGFPEGGLIEVFHNSTSSMINQMACESYTSPGGKYIYTSSGVYKDFIPNAAGCDSIITINLTIKHSSRSDFDTVAYQNFRSPSGKYTWTMSGIYTDTIPNFAGCDSIIMINLRIYTSSILNSSACDRFVSPSEKYTWTASGTYIDTIPNTAGNDSVITVNLTVNHPSFNSINANACARYTSPSGKYTWISSSTYRDTIPNTAGCDSIITIDLDVDHVDTSVTQDRNILISNDENAEYQWIDCDEGYVPIADETFLSYSAPKNGHYAVIVSRGACVDTSAVYEVIGTGIIDPSRNGITLYPNPTAGTFTLDLGKLYPEALVTITRYDGQVIRRESKRDTRVIGMNLDVPPGIYMVTITIENREVNFRVVKN
jgi:uncharacterized repeat protein (TIGR03803 family)